MTTPYEQIKGMFSEMAEEFLIDTSKFDVFIAGYRAGKEKERGNSNISEAILADRMVDIGCSISKVQAIIDSLLNEDCAILPAHRLLLDIGRDYVSESQNMLKDLSDDIWEGRMSA